MSLRKFHEGWRIQLRVIHALMIRELHTRYGRENIGFLWIMVEPMLFAGLVSILWRATKGSAEHGVGIVAFTVTGYIPVVLFRHGVSRCVALFVANSSLMYHRQIKILDFVLVRFIIELLGTMMAYFFIATVLIMFGEFPVPSDIGLLIGGWMCYALFTLSLCLIIAPLSEMSEIMEKFIPVTTYIMLPFSGLFTMASWLTPRVREYILWSPFVNAMEMMRKGVFGNQVTAYYNIWNPIVSSVVLSVIGLALCRHIRKIIAVE
ncbi:ABC transporter permease [Novosphingobium sp. PY1]|uniref:ABC transporter permease n=1 Tax=Novosphingobium sp. PY1 TaxID=1882221 RepID=UPI001A8FDD63|nr:ABC transporter permease [Novosphingobium sp. PY1]GFM31468.1 putative capsule polysaccharide export inner-mem brane protein [Novosphingobium sp. PY1]